MSLSKPELPLRLAIIGLSQSAVTSWAASAHLPGLLTPEGRARYTITALCNSSVGAARAAIQAFGLPPTTKAYGKALDVALDPDIDAVICSTRVDTHYEAALRCIHGGKHIFLEWPIASNEKEISVLVRAARELHVMSRVAIGLQRRWAPPILKIREILDSGRLGRVLSSNVQGFGGSKDREVLPTGLKYFTQRDVGGNFMTIGVGHAIDWVLSVLGELVPGSVHVQTQVQRPKVPIRAATGDIVEEVSSDVPDLLSLHGTLEPSADVAPSATLTCFFRRGQAFPSTPALTWTINCEQGEIRMVSPDGLAFDFSTTPVPITVHHFDTNAVEDVAWAWDDAVLQVPPQARNIMRSLLAFADGEPEGDGWVDIETAAKRAAQIDGWLRGSA